MEKIRTFIVTAICYICMLGIGWVLVTLIQALDFTVAAP